MSIRSPYGILKKTGARLRAPHRGGVRIRPNTLWRVPVFCAAAGAAVFYLTVYLGRFFVIVETTGADGTTTVSADPLRSAILNGVFFILVLLAGTLWAFRSMTRREIALLQSWTAIATSALFRLTGHLEVSAFLACLAPFLFVPFGRRSL